MMLRPELLVCFGTAAILREDEQPHPRHILLVLEKESVVETGLDVDALTEGAKQGAVLDLPDSPCGIAVLMSSCVLPCMLPLVLNAENELDNELHEGGGDMLLVGVCNCTGPVASRRDTGTSILNFELTTKNL